MQGPIPDFLGLSMGTCPGQHGNVLASFSDLHNHPVIFNLLGKPHDYTFVGINSLEITQLFVVCNSGQCLFEVKSLIALQCTLGRNVHM